MPDLLLELLSEEIPARMQPKAAADLKRLVTDGLVERGLTYAEATAFATPRRLALAVTGLAGRSPALREERKGPRTDAPDAAIAGFLRATGLTRDQLETRDDRKAQVFFAVTTRPGRPAAEIVAETVEAVVRAFPWPKSMRWGDGSLRWVRPLHSILCLISTEAGAQVVPLTIDGIAANDTTRGHPFMAPEPFRVTSFEDYETKLARAFVLLDPADRAERIRNAATQAAFAQGLELVEDENLLAENAGLTEWPVTLTARIDPRFLDLPPEVLRTSMKEHQKFLSLRDPASGRITGYVVVANRETADDGATILAGNARVLAARLSDAEFFWQNDLRTVAGKGMDGLAELDQALHHTVFHRDLGSQLIRVNRISFRAEDIARALGIGLDECRTAALVCKSDLASQMVYEFPELQGTMGYYYASEAGLSRRVAIACREHYRPLGPSDAVAKDDVSIVVALADKLDTLVSFWLLDEKPSGSKDPFALRRAALGVIRTVTENDKRIALRPILLAAYGDVAHSWAEERRRKASLEEVRLARRFTRPQVDPDESLSAEHNAMLRRGGECIDDLLAFLHDRLKVHLRDQGIRHDVIDACLAMPGADDLVRLVARVRALQVFLATEDGANLLTGYKRAVNILEAEEKKDGVEYSLDPDPRFAETEAERALFAALDTAEPALAPKLAAEDFAGAMGVLADLRAPIDAFFETTTVNADSPAVRRNRLCLLNRIRAVMNRVAVFGALEGA